MAQWEAGGAFLGRVAGFTVKHARIVIGLWIAAAAVLNVAVPQLESVVAKDTTPFVPESAQSIRAYDVMDDAFGSGKSRAPVFVVIASKDGIDETYYKQTVDRLEAGTEHVVDVQDYVDTPELKAALVSEDGLATYIPVGLPHPVGSPEADKDVDWVRTIVQQDKPPGTETHVTGDAATVDDLSTNLNNSIARVTVITVILITLILILLYRSAFTPLVPLATIGVALLTARGAVALVGDQSVFHVSTYTGAFLTALVLGAGTDYTVFLISRYHEALRQGRPNGDAVVEATRRIGTVIVASGATVIIGSACMVAAKLALFHTTGPAIALAVFITLLVSLTLSPALLAVAGDRARPRGSTKRSDSRWNRIGGLVARRPGQLVLGCLVLLGALAALYPSMDPTYDTRDLVPVASESDLGYQSLDRHFTSTELRPDYLLIESDHDLRNARDLAVLDQVTESLVKVPGTDIVRSATRPQGKQIPQAQLPYDIDVVGKRLDKASGEVSDGANRTDELSDGAHQLSDGADQLSDGSGQATRAVDQFLAGLRQEADGLDSAIDGTTDASAGSQQLRDGAQQLAAALRDAHDQTSVAVGYLGDIYRLLRADQLCTADPVCNQARDGIGEIYRAQRDELLPGLDQAADAADDIAAGNGDLATGLGDLRGGLTQLRAGIDDLAAGEREFRAKLGDLAHGAHRLADGAAQIPDGVGQIRSASNELAAGLDEAAGFLTGTAKDARAAGIDAFYVPPGEMDDPRFELAKAYFFSSDGDTARILTFGDDDTERIKTEHGVVEHALRDTPLEDAKVYATGPAAVTNDIHDLAERDFRLVAVVVLIAVLMILILLLRALVAPLYLLGSVLLSYAAAMGVTTLIWQDILGKELDWTTPLLSFIVLVAVGADYNILLMSRVREESNTVTRAGVARAVAATGGVITSAGLIFAGTFVAMIASPVLGLQETGTAVAIGLLLDTFIVRSLFVPSIAALLGRRNWWPSRLARQQPEWTVVPDRELETVR